MNDPDLSPLRTPHPLRDADFAAIRARVMSRIHERPRFLWLRYAVAAALIIVVVALLFVPHRRAGVPPAVAGRPAPRPIAVGRDVQPLRAGRPLSTKVVRHKPRPAPEPEMRIEIHTADPDIRIIWIANSQPKFLKEES